MSTGNPIHKIALAFFNSLCYNGHRSIVTCDHYLQRSMKDESIEEKTDKNRDS